MHYSQLHPTISPNLKLKIIARESVTVRRKIVEAMYILNLNPEINLKIERNNLKQYLLQNSVQ